MSIFNIPLGINVNDNPIKFCPFVQGNNLGLASPPPGTADLITEGGSDILTEGGDHLITE